jgi:hypothetical protein
MFRFSISIYAKIHIRSSHYFEKIHPIIFGQHKANSTIHMTPIIHELKTIIKDKDKSKCHRIFGGPH